MNDAPPPIVAEGTSLAKFSYMPLEIARLTQSGTWARCRRKPELAFYHLNLWMHAWHQVPAGSLEDDDFVLADAARCSDKVWKAVRAEVLRGWMKCSDGRLYHRGLAERVEWACGKRQQERDRTQGARDALAARRLQAASGEPDKTVTEEPQPSGRRRGRATTKPLLSMTPLEVEAAFERFWEEYPNRTDRKKAREASWPKALAHVNCDVARIMDGLAHYKRTKPVDRDWMHPTTFLNGARYDDKPAAASGVGSPEADPMGVFRDRGGNGLNDRRMRKSEFERRYGKFPRGPYSWEPLPDGVT